MVFFPPVSSRRQEVKAKCSLTCEYLTEEDYTDLLWTTLSEFPGKEQREAPVFPWNGSGCGNGLWQQQWNWQDRSLMLPTALRAPCCACGSSLPWDHHSRKKSVIVLEWPLWLWVPLQEEENQLNPRGRNTGIFIHQWLSRSIFKGWWVQWIHGELAP